MPRLLLVAPSHSYRVADFLRAAERMEVDVTLASECAPALAFGAAHVQVVFKPPGEGVSAILAHAQHHPIDAVIASDDAGAALAAHAARALGLTHDDPQAVTIARDKHLTRLTLRRAGLPTPWFRRVPLDGDLHVTASRIRYPAVVKPLHLAAGQGVIRVDDSLGFLHACRRVEAILARRDDRASRRHRRSLLVEGYIPGREVSLEGVLDDGVLTALALFDKPGVSTGPYFEETVYVTPSSLSAIEQSSVCAQVARAAAAMGLRRGVVHAECRINDDGVWLIELAPRGIGGLCSRALAFEPERSLEEVTIAHALGTPWHNNRLTGGASAVMMIPIPGRGRLRAVHGVAASRRLEHITDVSISISCGDIVEPLPEGDRYLGFIFARAERTDSALAALEAAHRCLSFDICSRA